MNRTVTFAFTRSTPGTHLYAEVREEGKEVLSGRLYLRKAALPNSGASPPSTVTINLQYGPSDTIANP